MKTALNLPPIEAAIRLSETGREEIFDPLRRRFVALTPEEWVRQHMIGFLTGQLGYPASLISVETALKYNRLRKRTDIVIHGTGGQPGMIVECKAPEVPLTRAVLEQAAMYNMPLQVKYLVLTNGLQHHILFIDREAKKFAFLERFPGHGEL